MQNGSGNGSVTTFKTQLIAALQKDYRGTHPLRAFEITGTKNNLTVTIHIDVAEDVAAVTPDRNIADVLSYPSKLTQLVALLAQKCHVTVTRIKIIVRAGAVHGQCDISDEEGFTPDKLKDRDQESMTPRPRPPLSEVTDPQERREGIQRILHAEEDKPGGGNVPG